MRAAACPPGPAVKSRTSRDRRPWVLAVGGLDPTASAGIVADARSIEALGGRPAIAATALTVQTGGQVMEVSAVPPERVVAQMEAVFGQLPVAAVKIGLVPRPATARAVARLLRRQRAVTVVDPVVTASAGTELATAGTLAAVRAELFPIADLVTVNLEEAARLCGFRVTDAAAMEAAAQAIAGFGPDAVLVKGGHLAGQPRDFLWAGGRGRWFSAPRLKGRDMHGSGCALAAAAAAALARGLGVEEAVAVARRHARRLIARATRGRDGAWLR
ncbi:MAG: hydroxymethylpyrimidine/phosphomethylpyrimidine kinase [Candidatus Dadabacteria bacterium]|nr:MAG: hydroxymethylpyrimidine/phosphomethylpyrimidine kinase [Candidatus Dadabacteria bacterium]